MSVSTLHLSLVLGAGLVLGCLPDEPCGPDMSYEAARAACVCVADAIVVSGGCQRCATDEVVLNGTTCGCAAGSSKNAEGVCAVVRGLGDPCSPAEPCGDAVYSHCGPDEGAGATCTRTCAVDDDCPAAYTCTSWEATPYCRLYTGIGESCEGPADCAAYDATLCGQGQCAVAGCSLELGDCPRGLACCDFSAFGIGTVCAPAEYCP